MDTVGLLADLLRKLPVSIEVLPGDGQEWIDPSSPTKPFLFEEGHLGIPLKPLYNAYMHACLSYKKAKKSPNRSQADLLDSTSVILCANPSHRTALNTRKRLVLAGTLDPKWELKFTTSLLTRRECSKEAILWHHRRWLLHRIHGVVMVSDTSPEIEPWPLSSQVVRDEFAIVSLGCELYPRNYFAWAHRYFCMKCLSLSTSPFSQSESFHPMEALIDEYQSMLYWVERHISDYSAMQYLCRVESTIQNLSITSPTLHLPGSIPSLRTHAELLLQSYPDHESIWMYLRGTATPIHSSDLPNSSMLANYGPNSLVYLARHRVWAAHEAGTLKLTDSIAQNTISGGSVVHG